MDFMDFLSGPPGHGSPARRRCAMQTIGLIARFFRLSFPYPVPAVLMAVLLPGPAGGVTAAFAQTFQTSAPHAILIDSATQRVLFEKDADALVVPASPVQRVSAGSVFH